jgi:hypothetical protein
MPVSSPSTPTRNPQGGDDQEEAQDWAAHASHTEAAHQKISPGGTHHSESEQSELARLRAENRALKIQVAQLQGLAPPSTVVPVAAAAASADGQVKRAPVIVMADNLRRSVEKSAQCTVAVRMKGFRLPTGPRCCRCSTATSRQSHRVVAAT